MTPAEIAERFPRLFHLTEPGALHSIRRHGLLSARAVLDLVEADEETRTRLLHHPRPEGEVVSHPEHGAFLINDNKPLSERALKTCLDDGLTPADWLRVLNGKVFFWADERGLQRLLGAKANAGRNRDVLVLDTLALARAHIDTIAFSPINSGSTIRKPARRGLSTFARVKDRSFSEWRRLRGRLDTVLEITVDDAVPNAADYVVEVREIRP